jgi:hypothetical protein
LPKFDSFTIILTMNRREFLRTAAITSFGLAAQRLLPLDIGSGTGVGVVRSTDIAAAVERAVELVGGKVLYVDDVSSRLYKQIVVKDGVYLKETLINRHVLESDVFINLPVAKTHTTAGLTIGMKNLMGITGDNRSRWHWDIHQAISDVNMAVPSDLTVVDATAIMTRRGPTGGSLSYLEDTDTIIASSGVAQADAETVLLFGKQPRDLGYLELAEQKGLGSITSYPRKEITL